MVNDPYILVADQESLDKLIEDLSLYEIAAVDTEADSMYHYTVRLCLIQITIGEHHYIVDPFAPIDITPIFKTRAMNSLILHGADYDLRMLWHHYRFSPKHVFDTMIAAKFLGEEGLGYASLVRKYFGIDLPKDNQKSDWTTRPLPPDMCEYAIHDTFYLHELCAKLGEQLKAQGKFTWMIETCNELIEKARQKKEEDPERWRISGSFRLQSKSLNILKHIWEWREKEAEKLDRPPYKVFGNELMLAIVRSATYSFPELREDYLPKLPRNFFGERRTDFLTMLQNAMQVPESEWPEENQKVPPPLISPDGELIDTLKEWRNERAAELHLDGAMLANRAQLIALATPIGLTWDDRYDAAHFLNWQRTIWNGILHNKLIR